MKTHITLGLIIFLNTIQLNAQDATPDIEDQQPKERTFQATFVPGFGTSNGPEEKYINKLSFNVIVGYEYGFDGLEVGYFYNINKSNVKGAQFAGFGNTVGGKVEGVQMAGFVNTAKDSVKGAQFAGFANIVAANVHAAQFSGFTNVVKGNATGSQFAGFTNVTTGNFKGLQAAGFVNVAKDIEGTQVAGFVNRAENVGGTQIAGFVNKAKNVKGSQIGFINIADSLDSGVAIGFLNIIKNGMFQFAVEHNDVMDANIMLRTGTKRLYSVLAVGVDTRYDYSWSYGAGFGTQFGLKNNVYGNVELSTHVISSEDNHFDELNLLNRLNLNIGYQISKRLSLNAGPTLNIYVTREYDYETGRYGSRHFRKKRFFNETYSGTDVSMWIGYAASLRF